jgi:hypothetical protein
MHVILLATAALVGLPILLHLLMKQEPKRLPFPALRFLQQKKRINQRKMRLRHFLLLLMRMMLIALFGLALFQPTLFSETLNFSAEQPIAVVFVVDTSPSMGYTANGRTRLEEARRRALELLDELPPGSRVAVLDPADPGGQWEQSAADARKKLEDLKEPRGAGVPVTTALATAYQLLRTVDQETEAAEPLPRLIAVFSDRAAACWDAGRAEDLVKLRDAVPEPKVAHLFIDVGIDQPTDVAVLGVDLKPQIVPQNQAVVLNATVQATGPPVADMVVTCRVTTANVPEQKRVVALPGGTPVNVAFKFDGLPPGLHQAEVALDPARKDSLAADNIRYVTFKVAEPRKFLTLSDEPRDADFWQLAHESVGEFVCEVKRPADAGDLGGYEVVCLLNVAEPPPALWQKLETFADAGGKVLLMPGPGPGESYDPEKNPIAGRLMPGTIGEEVEADKLPPSADPKVKRRLGVTWLIDDAAMRHPMLAKFREWKLAGYDAVSNPRLHWKYLSVKKGDGSVIVYYDDADDPKDRHPAMLERTLGGKGGRVVLLTTRMDPQRDPRDRWNNYWEEINSSWQVVFPNLLLRYLAGDPSEANFNYATGRAVPVPLPKGDKRPAKLRLEGPGVSGRDAEIEPTEQQTELRLPPAKTLTAGSFVVSAADGKWKDGFSLNPPAEEWTLDKVPAEAVEGLFGPESVVPVGKDVKLHDKIAEKFNQPVDLFPWLLILVLLLIAAEGVVANRFYRPQT